ncbi:hypothetical protein HDU88_006671 [Geranomyces variabilis]|nr:hypothetical protein HDU88_006671 [Geranomyces variabilis]
MTDSKASSNAGSNSSGTPIGAAKSAPLLPPTSSPVSTRLYIGNLPPSLTEYHLAALFSPFGELTKIDYLWHKHGPHRGEPRGYCFIEYADVRSACAAVEAFSGGGGGGDDKRSRVVNGRPQLVVRFSVESAGEEGGGGGGGSGREKLASSVGGVLSTASGGGGAPTTTPTITRKRTKGAMDVARNSRDMQEPVNAKLQARVGHTSMNSKISAIERKLLQLQSSSQQQPSSLHLPLQPPPRSSSSSLNTRGTGSGGGGGGGGVGGSAAQNPFRRTTAPANVRHKPYDKRGKE